jgi:hypothetical protein
MRIIEEKSMKSLKSILIMLTPSEASELASSIRSIDPTKGEHIHVDDLEYAREITIAIYTDQNEHFFTKEIRDLIKAP